MKYVSVIVPVGGEVRCRESLENQNYRHYEVIYVDEGKSFAQQVNVGLKKARGDLIMICGAHSVYPPHYISRLAGSLARQPEWSQVANIGGCAVATGDGTKRGDAIAECLTSFWGTGGSEFRHSAKYGQIHADTVFGGCYPREVYQKIGYFNEQLGGSADLEYNWRIRMNGGTILLLKDLAVKYFPKNTFWEFFKHNFKDGFWVTYPDIPMYSFRHKMPMYFVLCFPLWVPWLLLSLMFSKGNPFLFLAFFCRHFGYGLGSLWGLLKRWGGAAGMLLFITAWAWMLRKDVVEAVNDPYA